MNQTRKSGFKPLPETEVEICQRLVLARKEVGLRRVELAAKLGPACLHQLTNVELARVPLKWEMGHELCSILNLSQWWLATGQEPMHPNLGDFDPGFGLGEVLFSSVCAGPLKREMELRRDLLLTSNSALSDKIAEKSFEESLLIAIKKLARTVPARHRNEILDWAPKAIRQRVFDLQKKPSK